MEILHVTEQEYETQIKEGIVLVDFFAEWCGPCKMLSPILETLADQRADVKVLKVNVDEQSNLAQSFGVFSIPTLILYNNGKLVEKKTGFQTIEMLNEWIDSVN